MKLLIHDLNETEWNRVAAEYDGWDVVGDNGQIHPCVGCFGCWLKTPGACVIKDGFDDMGKRIHRAEEVVILSRYTYGGCSGFVKNVLDRSIGYLLPFFGLYHGEMHHQRRYHEAKPFRFIFRGHGLTEEDKERARRYVEAVRRNFHGRVKEIRFEEEERPVEAPSAPLQGAVAGKTLLLNCSPRGEKANSKRLLDVVGARMEEGAESAQLLSTKTEELLPLLASAEKLVLSMPLYVDGIPSPLLRLMEQLEKAGWGEGRKVYVVANMGFYESKQIVNLLAMVKSWCDKCGAAYCGGVAVGAGGMMGQVMVYGGHGPGKLVYESLCALGEAVERGETLSDVYTKAYRFPRLLYLLDSSSRMRKSGERNGLKGRDFLRT